MKYLLVFYFAGFFLADAAVIKKYKLNLETKDDGFQGTVILTLSDSNNNHDVILDQYAYKVTECTYTGIDVPFKPLPDDITTPKPPIDPLPDYVTTLEPPINPLPDETVPSPRKQRCIFEANKITFMTNRTSAEVILQFKGDYIKKGLSKYETKSNDRFYVADMTDETCEIIFPSQEKVKAQFEFGGDNVVMSNLENLRQKGEGNEIFLRDLTFVQGDIDKDDTSIASLPFYHMKSSSGMGQKLKNVMEKVAKIDSSLKILFTPVGWVTPIISRDVLILSGVDLKPNDSGSDYSKISEILANKLLQRPKGAEKNFFDIIGPKWAAMKISGGTGFPIDEFWKYRQILELQEDGFSNSKSLNELASKNENSFFYIKGISVLYSLESKCGDEKFTEGLSNYARNISSKVNEAFEGCFENEAEAKEFFRGWTDEPGYPVVHVILNRSAQYYMNQEQFLWFKSEKKDRAWTILTDYKTKEGSETNITLSSPNKNVTVTINSTYFILDNNNTGFFRVNYDAKLWEALISQLKSNPAAIDPVSRMKLIDDVFSFPRSTYKFTHGTPDYVTAFKLSEYLKNETDFGPLKIGLDAIVFVDSALNGSYHGKFRNHAKDILNGIYNKITKVDPIFQIPVILLACKFGVEECIKNATATFNNIKWNTNKLSGLEQVAICSVVRNDSTKWMDLLASFNAMEISSTTKNFMLGCTRDGKALSLFLTQYIASKNKEEFTEAVTFAIGHNPDNIRVILDIIKRFQDAIRKAFGEPCLQEIVRLTLPNLNLESAVTLKEIAGNLKDEKLKQDVNRACENVELWTNTKVKSVGEYFKEKGKGTGSQAKPIALVLLATTLLPLANHIFHS